MTAVVFLGRRIERENSLRSVRSRERTGRLADMRQQRDRSAAIGRERLLPPVRVQKVEEVEDVELNGQRLPEDGRQGLSQRKVHGVRPRRTAAVARHDASALAVQAVD